jgi:hypothetical protein
MGKNMLKAGDGKTKLKPKSLTLDPGIIGAFGAMGLGDEDECVAPCIGTKSTNKTFFPADVASALPAAPAAAVLVPVEAAPVADRPPLHPGFAGRELVRRSVKPKPARKNAGDDAIAALAPAMFEEEKRGGSKRLRGGEESWTHFIRADEAAANHARGPY